MSENDDPGDGRPKFELRNYDDPNHPNYDDPNDRYYTHDDNGFPLPQEYRTRRLRLREEYARHAKWSPEECLAYLVKLGTHNPDGTVVELYTLPYEYGPFAGKE
jgi:hypothetical protein